MAKLVPIHQNVDELIRLAKQSNQKAQLAIYDRFSAKMLGLCRQYIKDLHFAEDVMITAFHKGFQNIHKYEPYGSFEAWLRQIMIRECISYLRVQKNKFSVVEIKDYQFIQQPTNKFSTQAHEIQSALDLLPIGCKTVFNLYIIEGYKHREIADLLGVSVGTSKSQFAHAKKLLKCFLTTINAKHNGTQ